jgi:hypothetical protein
MNLLSSYEHVLDNGMRPAELIEETINKSLSQFKNNFETVFCMDSEYSPHKASIFIVPVGSNLNSSHDNLNAISISAISFKPFDTNNSTISIHCEQDTVQDKPYTTVTSAHLELITDEFSFEGDIKFCKLITNLAHFISDSPELLFGYRGDACDQETPFIPSLENDQALRSDLAIITQNLYYYAQRFDKKSTLETAPQANIA